MGSRRRTILLVLAALAVAPGCGRPPIKPGDFAVRLVAPGGEDEDLRAQRIEQSGLWRPAVVESLRSQPLRPRLARPQPIAKRCVPGNSNYRRNPQDAALYLQAVLSNAAYSDARRRCLLTTVADALIAGAVTRDDAVLFPYSFPYALGRAGRLRAPWFSGLAQTTLMGSLLSIAKVTGDRRYERSARGAFESLFLPASAGGFVQPIAGGAWVQEYPSATPSYVLNGHVFSIMSAASFGRSIHDPRGKQLLASGAKALEALLPLYDVPGPGGAVSAYDLLRRGAGSALRITGNASIREAGVVDAAGRVVLRLNGRSLGSAGGVRPAYPVSVVAFPRLFVRLTLSGSGRLQALSEGRWITLATVPAGGATSVTEVPQRLQGRTINMRYHAIHVDVLRRLARATGNPTFARWADRWQARERTGG